MTGIATPEKTKPKDFASDQEVRWCPGCGDYAILKGVQRTLADMNVSRANTVFVSGIGCAARFPYYMSTYGFHTIHGRALFHIRHRQAEMIQAAHARHAGSALLVRIGAAALTAHGPSPSTV